MSEVMAAGIVGIAAMFTAVVVVLAIWWRRGRRRLARPVDVGHRGLDHVAQLGERYDVKHRGRHPFDPE